MTGPKEATQRYLVLWNSPRMLSVDEAAAWVSRELDAIRETLGTPQIGCWPTEGDDGPGWLLEIRFDSDDSQRIEEGLRDLLGELHNLGLRPRQLVTGASAIGQLDEPSSN